MQLELTTEYGLCKCGCGERTNLAKYTRRATGQVKGEPMRYLVGHQAAESNRRRRRTHRWDVVDAGYETPCWEWALNRQRFGYGNVQIDGRQHRAHRVVYEQMKGPIPDGLQLDHLCHNPPCVNPDHLEPVTAQENVHRSRVTKFTDEERARIAALPRDEAMARYGVSYGYWYELRARYGRTGELGDGSV